MKSKVKHPRIFPKTLKTEEVRTKEDDEIERRLYANLNQVELGLLPHMVLVRASSQYSHASRLRTFDLLRDIVGWDKEMIIYLIKKYEKFFTDNPEVEF